MGIEEQIDRLIDLGEDIKSRLDRLVEQGVMLKQPVGDRFVLSPESEMNSITFGEAIKKEKNHFADARKMVADEPPKKWRILHPGESVRASDWENEDLDSKADPPDGPGWRPASMWKNGRSVLKDDKCIYARCKIEQPEPEYREPVLPADAGEECEFSRDGKEWCKFLLAGWQVDNNPWICERYHCWPYARIKKDA